MQIIAMIDKWNYELICIMSKTKSDIKGITNLFLRNNKFNWENLFT